MSKTQLSSTVKVGRKTFTTNAKPDPYDFRDLEYRPVLQPLEPSVHANRQDAAFTVLTQEGQSCTGHAVAATINTVLTRSAQRSPSAPKVEAGQPVHALSPGPALRRPQRRSGRRVAAPRRLQGLASPRRRPRSRVEPAGGRPQGRRPSTRTSTSTSPTSWPPAGSDRSAPTTASTPTGSTTCSRPSASSTRSRSRPRSTMAGRSRSSSNRARSDTP